MHICLESQTNREQKVVKLEFDLNASNATFKKFNAGLKALDEIISVQKFSSYKRGFEYDDKFSFFSKPVNDNFCET